MAQKELAIELNRESSISRRQLSGWQSKGVVVVTGALEVEDADEVGNDELSVHVVLSAEDVDEDSDVVVTDEDKLSVQVVLSAEDVDEDSEVDELSVQVVL